jgi:exoribonuclease R
MNYHCAKEMLKNKNGIFRSTIIKKQIDLPSELPEDVNKFIKIWNSSCGQYVDVATIPDEQKESLIKHELLEVDAYIHITSPIRRLVDLLNIIQFQKNYGMISLSPNAFKFFDKWISEIDYINVTMRAIRKVQNDCNLLDTCYNDPSVLEKLYDGYCFDKLVRNDGLYQFMVFLPELRLSSRITLRENLDNFEKRQYKLFLFSDEEKFKKKIRLHLV